MANYCKTSNRDLVKRSPKSFFSNVGSKQLLVSNNTNRRRDHKNSNHVTKAFNAEHFLKLLFYNRHTHQNAQRKWVVNRTN